MRPSLLRRTDKDREADTIDESVDVVHAGQCAPFRLVDAVLCQHRRKLGTVFGIVNVLCRRTEDGHILLIKVHGEVVGNLPTCRYNHAVRIFRIDDILVIECNLRASRSFPFVSKVLKLNFIDLATKIMLGVPVEKPGKNLFDLDYVGIKASQFSFNRLQKADPVLGVDMSSTGEVGCLGDDTSTALLKSMLSVGQRIPKKTVLLSTGGAKQKAEMLDAAKMLKQHGYELYATVGTSKYLTENGIENTLVYMPSDEGKLPQAISLLHEKKIDMVVNMPKDLTPRELTNGYKIRRAAIDLNVPLITNSRLASAFIHAFCNVSLDDIDIKAWGEY